MDWAQIRATKMAPESPPEWPGGVKAISLNGLTLFGIHEKTGRLYWDGIEVITRDRWAAYANACSTAAPNATQVADRFHLIGNIRC